MGGQQQQTATPEKFDGRTVTVTMPIHPFVGRQFPIVQVERGRCGQREYLTVAHPTDGFLRLPIGWTDIVPSLIPPVFEGHELFVTVEALLTLAAACSVATNNNLDFSSPKQRLTKKSCKKPGAMDDSDKARSVPEQQTAAGADRRSGDLNPQSAGKRIEQGEGG